MEIIVDDKVTITFDHTAKGLTKISYEGSPSDVQEVKENLSSELVARGHFFRVEEDYPGNVQTALNQAYDLGLMETGAYPPPAPEGAND